MMKRILSLLMALCMIGTLVPGTVFAAEQELPARMEQIEIPVQVNPLYADVVEPEEFHRQGGEYVPMAEAVYLPEAQAAVEVRKHLKNRTESFTVYLSVPEITFEQAEIERIVVSLFEAALAHTGDPLEGDYLRWQYGSWGVPENGITYGVDGSKMTMAINYMVEYYTTAEQEAELTGRVNQLLAELDLEDVCDYETLREIYSYIISHVVYDYDNLNNYNHKLKYTAYAALINGTAVCQGYSVLLYRLALELGLDARLVPGDSNNDGSTDHAWSILELNGQYYNADATWDSEIGQFYYFLRGSDNFPDHTPDYSYLEAGFAENYPMSAADFQHSVRSETTAPTCTEGGYTTCICNCGDSYRTDRTEAVGHSWDSGSVTKEPTETETGVRTYTCTACGATREEELPKLDHEHSYQSSVTAPTCTEEGYTTYTCACGDSYVGDKVPALGHTEVVDPAVEATCTESGLTEGKHCSVCEQVLIARETVPAKGHAYENGICAVCGAEDPTNPSEPEETDPTDPSEPEETDPTDPSEPEETDPTDPSEPEETDPTDPSEPGETDPTNPSEPEEHTHQFSEWITVKEPTGREEGMEERRCVCGEIESRAVPKLTNPFSDVKKTDYFYDSVLWAAHRGITSGITATRFAPTQPCTRAQVVTFLWRAAGEPEPVSGKKPFTDVNPAAYYYKAVLWAVEEGITSGMSATTFGPNRACTRGQVVTFLWRTAGEPEAVHQENSFTDVNPGAFYYKAVLWAVENGITTGMGSGSFAPGSTCTRGQIVTFLYRAFTKQ